MAANYSNFSRRGSNWNGHQNQGGGRNNYRSCGRGRGRSYNNRPQCQLCGKVGHIVLKCYYRFDQNFHGSGAGNTSNSKLPIENAPLEAMLTCGDNQGDSCWYPDSGATNHITNDFKNMAYGSDYNGTQKVHMGNGTGLSIKHIDNSYISCSKPSKSLTLKHILHVPKITKNLLSVSQFTKDNNVIFEFNSSSCFVKDQVTKTTLLRGILHKGLYRFDLRDERKNASGQPSKALIS
ncbi:hypothetical protein UlMin_028211 [Ulmus minor]